MEAVQRQQHGQILSFVQASTERIHDLREPAQKACDGKRRGEGEPFVGKEQAARCRVAQDQVLRSESNPNTSHAFLGTAV